MTPAAPILEAITAPHADRATPVPRRALLAGAGGAALLLLGGCAAMNTLTAEVSSFGEWPAGRSPGSYAFERLPSQQARAQAQDALEAAARPALREAGFAEAPAGQEPEVRVQVGARLTRVDAGPWGPQIGIGGYWAWGRSPWWGPGWGLGWQTDLPR